MTVGERIKGLRISLGMSQVAFADKINVSKQTLYKYENNIITNIPSDKIEAAANIGNVSPAYLMGWDDDIDMSNEDNPFYFDDETAEIAHDMYYHARSILKVYQSEDKDKLIEYANTLLLAQQYKDYERKAAKVIPISSSKNDYLYADAANQNPDATPEQTAFDDDVMDDPDF